MSDPAREQRRNTRQNQDLNLRLTKKYSFYQRKSMRGQSIFTKVRQSTMKSGKYESGSIIKRRQSNTRKEFQKRKALNVVSKRSKKWTDRSMIFHILTYIFIIFAIYAVVFITLLYQSSLQYESSINQEMEKSMRSEAARMSYSIIDSVKYQMTLFFEL